MALGHQLREVAHAHTGDAALAVHPPRRVGALSPDAVQSPAAPTDGAVRLTDGLPERRTAGRPVSGEAGS